MTIRFQQPLFSRQPTVQLLCLHAAGGSAAQFLPWARWLPGDVALVAPTLPRPRADSGSTSEKTLSQVAAEIADAAPLRPELPVVLFGHSLGAIVAFEVVARRLLETRDVEVSRLVVAAASDPRIKPPAVVDGLTDDALLTLMRRLYGGFDGIDLDDPMMRRLVVPPLRADLALLETYAPPHAAVLELPLTVLRGEQDQTTTPAATAGWEAQTRGPVVCAEFPGGHFFFAERNDRFESMLAGILRAAAA